MARAISGGDRGSRRRSGRRAGPWCWLIRPLVEAVVRGRRRWLGGGDSGRVIIRGPGDAPARSPATTAARPDRAVLRRLSPRVLASSIRVRHCQRKDNNGHWYQHVSHCCGCILEVAVDVRKRGSNLHAIGVIFNMVGAIGVLLPLMLWTGSGGTGDRRDAVGNSGRARRFILREKNFGWCCSSSWSAGGRRQMPLAGEAAR